MEGLMAIGVGYVFMLTPAIIVFLVLRAQQNGLEKRLDALVQMSRISGEAVGIDEISQSLVADNVSGRLRRWGIILTITALGVFVAGFTGSLDALLPASLIIGALGVGLLAADRLSFDNKAIETDSAVS